MFSVIDIVLISETYRFCNVASFAIAVTDYFICLPQEVELIWPTRWSTGKVLYILTRYSVFTDSVLLLALASPNHSVPTCERLFTASAWLTIVGMIISETVLVFRTWAVWERNLKLFIILLTVLLAGATFSLVFARISLARVEFGTAAEGYPPGCWLVAFLNPIIIFDYIIILSFEIIILVLTLYKCRQAIKSKRSKLLITLHRDAILYCFFIAVWSLANIINQVIPSANAPSFEELQRVIHSVLTARILLNLRQAIRASETKLSQSTLPWEPAGAGAGGTSANTNSSTDQDQSQDQNEGGRTGEGGGVSSLIRVQPGPTSSRLKRNLSAGSRSRSRSTRRSSAIRRHQWNVATGSGSGTSTGAGTGTGTGTSGMSSIISGGPVGRYLSAILDLDEESWAHDEESARYIESEDPDLFIEMTALSPRSRGGRSRGESEDVRGVDEGPSGSGRGSRATATEDDLQVV